MFGHPRPKTRVFCINEHVLEELERYAGRVRHPHVRRRDSARRPPCPAVSSRRRASRG